MLRKRKKLRFYKKTVPDGPKYQNPYFPKKKLPAWAKVITPTRVLYLIFLTVAVYFFLFSLVFKIKTIEISGNAEITKDQINEAVNAELSQNRFFIFSRNNFFMAKEQRIEDCLTEKFVLKKAQVIKNLPGNLIIEVEERIPNLTYTTQEKYFYLDLDGNATHSVEKDAINESFPKLIDKNNRPVKLGENAVPENIVSLVIELTEKIPNKAELAIKSFAIPEISCPKEEVETEIEVPINSNSNSNTNKNKNSNENSNSNRNSSTNKSISKNTNTPTEKVMTTVLKEGDCDKMAIISYIEIKTEDGFDIYFPSNNETDQQIIKLILLLNEIEDKTTLSYIDLRFGEKVYYK